MLNNFRLKTFALAALAVALTACGDQYRQVPIPIFRPGPDPAVGGVAFTLHRGVPYTRADGTTGCDDATIPCNGAASRIDVPGDVNLGNRLLNPDPAAFSFFPNSTTGVVTAHPSRDTVTVTNTVDPDNPGLVFALPPGSRPVHTTNVTGTSAIFLVAALNGTNQVAFITTSDQRVARLVPVGASPVFVLPVGRNVYVANQGSGTVSVIAADDGTVVATIPVGASPVKMALSADAAHVYVANRGSNSVSVIRTTDFTVVGTVGIGGSPADIAFDARNLRVFTANPANNNVSVIDASTAPGNKLLDIAVGTEPVQLAVRPDGAKVYTANRGSNDVSVIDTRALSAAPRRVFSNGGSIGTPVSVAVSRDGSKLYVAAQGPTQVPGEATTRPRGTVVLRTANEEFVTVVVAPYMNTTECPASSDPANPAQQVCESQRALPIQVITAAQ